MDEENGESSFEETGGQVLPDDEDIAEIKGDAIGNTLYSERWVLKTLISLSQYNKDVWNSDFEQEICLLWDMTVEKDVVLFLHQHDYYSIFLSVLESNNGNHRLSEMMVGILGNMCVVEDIRKSLSEKEDLCLTLVKLLSYEDSLTLVQLIRLLSNCLWTIKVSDENSSNSGEVKNPNPAGNSSTVNHITDSWIQIISNYQDYVLHQIKFFFFSSTNEELLCSTLQFLDILLRIPNINMAETVAKSPELIGGLTECLKQLLKILKPGDSIIDNKRLWRGCAVWNDIISEIAVFDEGLSNLEYTGNNLFKCLMKLLKILSNSPALRTQDSEVVSEFLYIVEALDDLQLDPYVVTQFITVLYIASQETAIKKSENSVDAEILDDLTNRIKKLFQKVLGKCDDLNSIFERLKDFELDFVSRVAEDEELKNKVNRAMLNIKTNGLI